LLRRNQETEERQRREQLRRALATQRARFGAGGVSPAGGSAEALLTGLAAKEETNIQAGRGLTDFRIEQINNDLAERRRRNLLEQSSARNQTIFNLLSKGARRISLLGN